jgi:zinc transport system substrate-binding protein
LAAVLQLAKEQGACAVFVQPQFSSSSARKVANQLGLQVVALDPLSPDYLANMRHMARAIRRAFGR